MHRPRHYHRRLARQWTRSRDDGRFRRSGMLGEQILDLLRVHVADAAKWCP